MVSFATFCARLLLKRHVPGELARYVLAVGQVPPVSVAR